MMYNNFSIVDYQKSEDENKAIQKLAEHRDIKLMVKEIGEKYGIDIQSTEGNSHLSIRCVAYEASTRRSSPISISNAASINSSGSAVVRERT